MDLDNWLIRKCCLKIQFTLFLFQPNFITTNFLKIFSSSTWHYNRCWFWPPLKHASLYLIVRASQSICPEYRGNVTGFTTKTSSKSFLTFLSRTRKCSLPRLFCYICRSPVAWDLSIIHGLQLNSLCKTLWQAIYCSIVFFLWVLQFNFGNTDPHFTQLYKRMWIKSVNTYLTLL